jgi:hypothetical protein
MRGIEIAVSEEVEHEQAQDATQGPHRTSRIHEDHEAITREATRGRTPPSDRAHVEGHRIEAHSHDGDAPVQLGPPPAGGRGGPR